MFRITTYKSKITNTWYLPSFPFAVRYRTLVASLSFTLHLTPPGSLIPTQEALTLHEPDSNEPLALGAVQLVHAVLLDVALCVQGPGLYLSAPQ